MFFSPPTERWGQERVELVARYLYKHDGNPNLGKYRVWELLSAFWQERYRENARDLLTALDIFDA